MHSYAETVYQLEETDTLSTIHFDSGGVGLSHAGYMSRDVAQRGFRIDFLPCHIPQLKILIELLQGAPFALLIGILLWSAAATS